jgi:hypothetical protein
VQGIQPARHRRGERKKENNENNINSVTWIYAKGKGKNNMTEKKDEHLAEEMAERAVDVGGSIETELKETLLKYDFSQDELVALGEQVAAKAEEISRVEAEFDQIKKQFKADLDGLELLQKRLITLIRDKFEMKKMECFKVIDGQSKKVWFFRTDLDRPSFALYTMERLRFEIMAGQIKPDKERNARPSELQRELPMKQPEGDA